MQIKDTSTRPRNLCWAISVAGALLFAVGVVIKNNGFSSVMTPTLVTFELTRLERAKSIKR